MKYHPLRVSRSQRLNIEDRLGYHPSGMGPYRFLTQTPQNEAFQINLVEKEFCCPRLPGSWNGLSLLHLTDLHFSGDITRVHFDYVRELSTQLEPDLIVFVGDLLDDQKLADRLSATLGQPHAPLGGTLCLEITIGISLPELTLKAFSDMGWTNVTEKCPIIEHCG